jgi:hypothetical protein
MSVGAGVIGGRMVMMRIGEGLKGHRVVELERISWHRGATSVWLQQTRGTDQAARGRERGRGGRS